MCPFSSGDRSRCWERWFGESNIGVCRSYGCKKVIYRNAGPDSVHHWHAGHIRSAAQGGSDNYQRNCAPICDECNWEIGSGYTRTNKR